MKNISTIAHHTPGRTRLVPKFKPTAATIESLKKSLESIENVIQVTANSTTGSFLIHHEMELAELISVIVQLGLFEDVIIPPAEETVDIVAQLHKVISQTDDGFQHLSKSSANYKSMVALGFCALGIYQIFQGRSLAAASSLFADAFKIGSN
jgi:hypothetical protein